MRHHSAISWARLCLVLLLAIATKRSTPALPSGTTLNIALDRLLSSIYPLNEPGAAIRVDRDGKTILRKGYGIADLKQNVPITPTTAFHVGSVTKQFTAVAILKLVEQGRLSLSDPVARFIPTISGTFTIEQLLTHTSGLRSFSQASGFTYWSRLRIAPTQILSVIQAEPRSFPPGLGWEYSDSGYFILGLVIERVSGKSYSRFIEDMILSPLGMKNTRVDDSAHAIRGMSAGYVINAGTYERAPYINMSVPYSAGAITSTVDDLAIWDRALYGERLIGRALLAKAFSPYLLPNGESTYYGYGWAINNFRGEALIEHGGRINGFECHIIRVPARRIFIAVLSNVLGRELSPDDVATKILMLMLTGAPQPPTVQLPPLVAQQYIGQYRLGESTNYDILRRQAKLVIRRGTGEERELLALGNDEFGFRDSFTRLHFSRDSDGTVSGLFVKTKYGGPRAATKLNLSSRRGAANRCTDTAPADQARIQLP
jgi:D-alanyl-D-alanine carboxypeptidase